MSSLSKIFEKPFSRVKSFFLNENVAIKTSYTKKKSEEFDEHSFGIVENQIEISELYLDEKRKSKESEIQKNINSTISLYENEYSDFVILEFGDAKIITKEEWAEIFKRKKLGSISHKDLYVSLQKGIDFLTLFFIFFFLFTF